MLPAACGGGEEEKERRAGRRERQDRGQEGDREGRREQGGRQTGREQRGGRVSDLPPVPHAVPKPGGRCLPRPLRQLINRNPR